MLRIFSVFASAIIIIILLTSSALAPIKTAPLSNASFNEVFEDIVADYALLTSLLYDVNQIDQYRVSLHANDPDSTVTYLTEGFDPALAAIIANYYLEWIPQLDKMTVIPMESIPVITEPDKSFLNMQQISADKVVMERIYNNCYEAGDKYIYRITAIKKEGNWIIVDLQLYLSTDVL